VKATYLIAASLIVGTAAWAQTTPTPSAAMPQSTTNPAAAPVSTANPDATTPGAMPSDQSGDMNGMNNMNSTPGMAGNAQSVSDASVDTSNYPMCSRTVTDKCVQRGAWHKAHPHH
jgi:hypothetical protein